MKLLTKTSISYVLVAIPLMLLAGYLTYYIINNETDQNIDELLLIRKHKLEQYLKTHSLDVANYLHFDNEIIIQPTVENGTQALIYSDTLVLEEQENELEPYRKLYTFINTPHGSYEVKILRSKLEQDELLFGIFSGLIVLLFFLIIVLLIINWIVARTLWRPFYSILNRLTQFRIDKTEVYPVTNITTSEFRILDETINKMIAKMQSDFRNQKEFVSNASHELLTPIAVMQSKMELLIQSPKLAEEEMELVQALGNSLNQMTRLNNSLLLLSKIENNQFIGKEDVLVEGLVSNAIEQLEEYALNKNILITSSISSSWNLLVNKDLFEICIRNILQNAIKHNYSGGRVNITITNNTLTISNTSHATALDPNLLFKRFSSQTKQKDSHGLGLAIAYEITAACHLKLLYNYTEHLHEFKISYKK